MIDTLQADSDLIPQEINPLDEIDFINFDAPLPQPNQSTVQAVEKPLVDYSNTLSIPLIQVQHNLVMPASNFHRVVNEMEKGEVGSNNQTPPTQKPVQPHYPQKPVQNNVQPQKQPEPEVVNKQMIVPSIKTPEQVAEDKRWEAEDNKFNLTTPKMPWYSWVVIALGVGVLIWYFFIK